MTHMLEVLVSPGGIVLLCTEERAVPQVCRSVCQCLQANNVQLYWNAPGTALLAITASDVDVTNQSYYGEQKIHYLAADGSNDCLVPSLKVQQPCLPLTNSPGKPDALNLHFCYTS